MVTRCGEAGKTRNSSQRFNDEPMRPDRIDK
jgi:hypothetical protein